MTHSHDTSTPAMSDETVPSEEFVLVPRDRGQTFSNSTLPTEMIAAGMEVLERADDDLAGRNGEDVPDWDYGMEAVAVYRAMIAAAPAPNPSPAAKGGDAVRSHDVLDEAKINALPLPLIARFAGDKDWLPIHDIGVDAPLCRIDVSGKLEPRRFSEIMELKDGDGVIHNPDDFYLDADTPTEGPASQTEGMGGDASRTAVTFYVNDADVEVCKRKFGAVDGFDGMVRISDLPKAGWTRAALTAPETAEAVPDDLTAAYMAGVERGRDELRAERDEAVKALRKIEEEAKVANDVIRLNRDGQGQGRVRVVTAMHRIAEWTRAALATEASR